MAVNVKGIERLWNQYSEDGVKQGISVAQFFESNGVPYRTFEKWYKKKFSSPDIVDCVLTYNPDVTPVEGADEKSVTSTPEQAKDVYVSYVSIG